MGRGASRRASRSVLPQLQGRGALMVGNYLSDLYEGRRAVTPADQAYAVGGALYGVLLETIGVARVKGRRHALRMAAARLDPHDLRDVRSALGRWRPGRD